MCYVMAKESSKYHALLELESHHGVKFDFAYSTPDSAKLFISYIAEAQRIAFLDTLSAHFF